ncbi:hypothetical protein AMC78_CH01110 [Rhizobium phaseoli]|uniref:hypothetical protein n=1 Tax=Rhizobium phaseoli TaxID=396 RepID=UPI0007EABEB0|nr:hypothetical protein [Rhizobium phaseoli]ANM03247.1 hypothetical protein AMC78_CH01110 [Rhizobium phaseoli]
MIFRRPLWIIAVCVLLGAHAVACSPSPKRPTDADIAFLASDAHVIVGGVPLIMPFVALTGFAEKPSFSVSEEKDHQAAKERRERFGKAAGSRAPAPSFDNLEIRVRAYGWNDFDTSFKRICTHLTRQWSQSVCNDPASPLLRVMPRDSFYLVDDRRLDAFQNHWTVGGERVSDQLEQMRLRYREPSVVCDAEPSSTGTRFCTAAVAISGHLAAVWTVWSGPAENSLQAERQGAAIAEFVLNALGPSENFPALSAAAFELTKPTVPTGPLKR